MVLVELRADWIPATLVHLDARVAEGFTKPREVVDRATIDGWLTPDLVTRADSRASNATPHCRLALLF